MITPTVFQSTSSGSVPKPAGWIQVGILSVVLAVSGHCTATASTNAQYLPAHQTSAVPAGVFETKSTVTPASAVLEIRRLGRLQWDELADLFNVSRRSVHFWANGSALSASNEKLVYEMLEAFRSMDRGSASQLRSQLFQKRPDGSTAFADLKHGRMEHIFREDRVDQPSTRNYIKLNENASKARRPLSVGEAMSSDAARFDLPAEPIVRKKIHRVL